MELGPLNRVSVAIPAHISTVPNEDAVKARQIVAAVRAVNQTEFSGRDRLLTFMNDPLTHRTVVRIVDRSSGEIIDQMPSEQVLQMAAELAQQRDKETT